MSIEMEKERVLEPYMTERQAEGRPSGSAARPTLRTRWYSVREAATLLGISEVAVRKRIADHSLTALKVGRGYRVLLAGEPSEKNGVGTAALARSRSEGTDINAMAALVRDLQQQSLALAGQIGYLQSQLAQAQEQLEVIAPSEAETPSDRTNDTAGMVSQEMHQTALDQIAELERIIAIYDQASAEKAAAPPPRRRWWPWRRS